MSIYVYHCPICNMDEEIILPMRYSNEPHFHSCGHQMQKCITLPQPSIIKQTGDDMALNSLNDNSTDYIKPWQKKIAAQGLKNRRGAL
jgi:hypothetical protein